MIAEPESALAEQVYAASVAKYGMGSHDIEGSYAVRPRVVFAWTANGFPNTTTRRVMGGLPTVAPRYRTVGQPSPRGGPKCEAVVHLLGNAFFLVCVRACRRGRVPLLSWTWRPANHRRGSVLTSHSSSRTPS